MIPDWAMRLPLNLIYCKASDMKLDSFLVAAIIYQESKGLIYAARHEPKYRYVSEIGRHAKAQGSSRITEETLQKTSFGLMQIMGGTARWLGYESALPALFKPDTNLYWGCKYLKYLTNRFPDSLEDAVAAYNAGSPRRTVGGIYENQEYVDLVFGYYKELTKR